MKRVVEPFDSERPVASVDLSSVAPAGVRSGLRSIPERRRGTPAAELLVDVARPKFVCTAERAGRLARRHHWPPTAEVIATWRNFILRDHDIGRTYALHLIDHVDVHRERVVIVPKVAGGRKDLAMRAAAE